MPPLLSSQAFLAHHIVSPIRPYALIESGETAEGVTRFSGGAGRHGTSSTPPRP
ncbi:MAG: hypothetical protein HY906_22290 [Deltaproteobacteria bacterium]|nr:hypothetical protein [Deltaproteobacteria bacterium]